MEIYYQIRPPLVMFSQLQLHLVFTSVITLFHRRIPVVHVFVVLSKISNKGRS